MFFKAFTVGQMAVNCYLLGCEETKEAVVIDPGGDAQLIMQELDKNDLTLKAIINTHGHIDHIGANDELRAMTQAKLLIHEQDATMLEDPKKNLSIFIGGAVSQKPADKLLKDKDTVEIGTIKLEVMHTPGHTLGGICLKLGNLLFSGDTLFAEGIGRADFPGGCHETLISSIRTKLMILSGEIKVYPGHGPDTTIGYEKKNNPFL